MQFLNFRVRSLLDFLRLIVTPHPQTFYIPPSVTDPVVSSYSRRATVPSSREAPHTTRRQSQRARAVYPERPFVGDFGDVSSRSSYYSSSYGSRSGSGHGDWTRGRGNPNDSRSSWRHSRTSGSFRNPPVSSGRKEVPPCCCSCHEREPHQDRKGKGRAFDSLSTAVPLAYNHRPFVWQTDSSSPTRSFQRKLTVQKPVLGDGSFSRPSNRFGHSQSQQGKENQKPRPTQYRDTSSPLRRTTGRIPAGSIQPDSMLIRQDREETHLDTSFTSLTASSSGSRTSRDYRTHSMSFELDLSPIFEDAQVFAMIDEMNSNGNNLSEEALGISRHKSDSPRHSVDADAASVSDAGAEAGSSQRAELDEDDYEADAAGGSVPTEPLLLPPLPIDEHFESERVPSRLCVRDSGISDDGKEVPGLQTEADVASYDSRLKHNSKESWWLQHGIQEIVNNGFANTEDEEQDVLMCRRGSVDDGDLEYSEYYWVSDGDHALSGEPLSDGRNIGGMEGPEVPTLMLTFATPPSTQDPIFPSSIPISLSNPSYLGAYDPHDGRGYLRVFPDHGGAIEFQLPKKQSRWWKVWDHLTRKKPSHSRPVSEDLGDFTYSAYTHEGRSRRRRRDSVGRLVAGTKDGVKQLKDLVKGFWVWESATNRT